MRGAISTIPTLPAPEVRQNQFGGSLGGPLPIANTFFFATYEGLRSKIGDPVQSLVPPAPLRTGDFTGQNVDLRSADAGCYGRARAVSQ